MGFKSEQKNLTFSDLEKSSTTKKNRSKETLTNMEKAIAWDKIESSINRNNLQPFLFDCLSSGSFCKNYTSLHSNKIRSHTK